MVIDSVVEKGDKAFDEAVFMLQHQIAAHKEGTNKKLQKLEATIEIAKKMMEIFLQMKVQKLEEEIANTFVWQNGRKDNARKSSDNQDIEKLQHLKLSFSMFEEAEVIDPLLDCEQLLALETYMREPIYDEEPGEGQECWPEQEFILAALEGGNLNSLIMLPSESCSNERSEDLIEVSNIQGLQQGSGNNKASYGSIPSQLEERVNNGLCPYCLALDGFQHVCKQACQSTRTKEEPATSLVNRPDRVIEDVDKSNFVENKDSPTAANSAGLGQKSSHLNMKNMLIFDPGGQILNKQLKGANHKSKDIIRSQVKLEEAVLKDYAGSQLRQCQDMDFLAIEQLLKEPSQLQWKVNIIEIGNSARLQGQGPNIPRQSDWFDKTVGEINQFVDYDATGIVLPYKYHYMVFGYGRPEMNKSMRTENHKALRKTVTICIFDPGGDLSCLNGVLVADSVGILKVHDMLKDILFESLSKMQGMTAGQVKGSEEVQDPP